jgi:NAD(P)H-dependent FMN reductase
MLVDTFIEGFGQTEGHDSEALYLNQASKQQRFVGAFEGAECVLIAFPLYCDSMPSIVKVFIESLAPLCGREANPRVMFLVHSGFPEAVQSRGCERYLAKLARRLGCEHVGTIIRGNTNRLAIQPGFVRNGTLRMFRKLGRRFGQSGRLDSKVVSKIAKPEKLGGFSVLMMRILDACTSMTTLYWDRELKKNGASGKSFDRPYTTQSP